MKFWYRLVRLAPVPRLRKIAWERWLLKREFGKLLLEAMKAQHPDAPDTGDVQKLQNDEHEELRLLYEEEESLRSQKLIALARKLDVPVPSIYDEEMTLSPDWQRGSVGYRFALSDGGRNRLREEIRKEIKARHEERVRWLAWVTPALALLGIVVTFWTRR